MVTADSEQNNQWRFCATSNEIVELDAWSEKQTYSWSVCKQNTQIRLWIQQNKYWFPIQKWKKQCLAKVLTLKIANEYYLSTLHNFCFNDIRSINVWPWDLCIDGLHSATDLKFRGSKISNLFSLALELVLWFLSPAQAARARGGYSWV